MPIYHSGLPVRIILLISLYYIPVIVSSQSNNNTLCKDELTSYTRKIYGSDDFVFQGRKYTYRNIKANGDPYFNSPVWKEAVIYSNGRSYSGLTIQYNIEQDIIILQVINPQGKTDFIYADNDMIDSLRFDDHFFVNLQKVNSLIQTKGFYEVVFAGDLLYVMKHSKQFVRNYNAINPYGAYTKQVSVLYIIQNNKLTACPAKKNFLHYFESHKKEIRQFMRQQHIQFRKAEKNDLKVLCRYADEISGMNK